MAVGAVERTIQDIDEGLKKLIAEKERTIAEAAERFAEDEMRLKRAREILGDGNGHAADGRVRAARQRAPRQQRTVRSGRRSTQALEIIREQPGITIPEIAARMEIDANYLYRVVPNLAEQGKVTRDERKGWHAAD